MLFAISGYAEMLTQDLSSSAPGAFDRAGALKSVQAITEATGRATDLTSQLLAFGRQQVVLPQVLDLNARIRAIEPMLRPLIGERVHLAMYLDPDAGRVLADPGQLDQILVNLVVNARDAMPDGGTVTIDTGNADFDAHVDASLPRSRRAVRAPGGDGQRPRDGPRRRASTSSSRSSRPRTSARGPGLGLATIYGIVRQAGGHIWLYSEPGLGSTFKLYFPRRRRPATETPPRRTWRPDRARETILVVEDDPVVRRMTTTLLERAGYDVTAFADGAEALAALPALGDGIDVLVTDVVMPRMSGIELAERVLERSPNVGLVLLSGYTAETLDLARLTARGAIFVSKPVTSAGLLDAMAKAMPAQGDEA